MTRALTLERVDPDAPIRLDVAARLAFPDGSMTIHGLRKERDAGRLSVSRVAGKDYTTLTDIKRMLELCRGEGKARAQGSITARSQASGTSGTAQPYDPQDALLATVKRLKSGSRNTSSAERGLRSGEVVPMKSRSPVS